jgi:two-component system, NarL family, sensor kinase
MYTHETSIYHAIIIIAITMGCIFGYVVYSLFRQHSEFIRRQRSYFSGEINLLEKELVRVSRDIHDDAGLRLSLLRGHLYEVKSPELKDCFHLEKAHVLLDELVTRLGGIAANLNHGALVDKGLEYALGDFFEETKELFGLDIEFIYEVNRKIDIAERINLYRIMQEITHNTVKHAKAERLTVHFKEKNQKLYLLCRDDGIGFEPEMLQGRKGMGLGSLKSRTEVLGGKLSCTTKLKYGTEYFFVFPFERNGQNN